MHITQDLEGLAPQEIEIEDASYMVVVEFTIQPGAVFPWRVHPDTVLIKVADSHEPTATQAHHHGDRLGRKVLRPLPRRLTMQRNFLAAFQTPARSAPAEGAFSGRAGGNVPAEIR